MATITQEKLTSLIKENNIEENTVLQVNNGSIRFVEVEPTKTVLAENQVSLHECINFFTRELKNDNIAQTTSELNSVLALFENK